MQIRTALIWQVDYLIQAQEAGVNIAINTDAHAIDQLKIYGNRR